MAASTMVKKGTSGGGWSSFFGNVGSSFKNVGSSLKEGVASGVKIAGETILPNWIEKKLHLQEKDQLKQTTYTAGKPRVEQVTSASPSWVNRAFSPVAPEGGANLKLIGIIIGGLVIMAIIIKVMR